MLRKCLAFFVAAGIVAALVFALEAARQFDTPAIAQPPPTTVLDYRITPQRTLRLHVFAPSQPTTTAQPAVVFFNGGGWITGDHRQFFAQSHLLAQLGLVAICAEYRVEETDGTAPMEALDDALHAVAWVRAHAPQLNVDPTRIAAGGGSAGAQLAAACATVPDPALHLRTPSLPASPRPDALLLFNPVLDNGPGPNAYGYDRIGDEHAWFSPAHNVRPQRPPTLILLGTQDHVVPTAVANDFAAAMHDAGNVCEVELYPGQGHGFFNAQPGKEPMFDATLRRSITFLQTHGWITPTP